MKLLCWLLGHRLNYFAWRFHNDTVCWRCGQDTQKAGKG